LRNPPSHGHSNYLMCSALAEHADFHHSPQFHVSTRISTMPAAATKSKATNGNGTAKGKTASTSGTATPVSTTDRKDTSEQLAALTGGRPDKKAYDEEQAKLKSEIDSLQTKLVSY